MKNEHAETLYSALLRAGIDFIAFFPDHKLHDLQMMALERGDFTVVPATNEGEAIALSAGAWLGGKHPAVIIADSGLLVGTFALGSLLTSLDIPVLLVVAHRGAIGDRSSWMFRLYQRSVHPLLDALQISCISAAKPVEAAEAIINAQTSATLWQTPVAVLLSGEVLDD